MNWCLSISIAMAGVLALAGCDAQKPEARPEAAAASAPAQPAAQSERAPPEAAKAEPAAETARAPAEAEKADLGPPLVDHPEQLMRLNPQYPVFIDKAKKQVVLVGQVCQRDVPLEMFACLSQTKEHEAIVAIPTKAMVVHAALLAVGAEPGAPAHFHPKFTPARGQEVGIELVWRDAQGEIKRARAQDWVRNENTGKALENAWVFAGSGFWTDPETGQEHYRAEGGDLICVSNFSSATLDLDIQSSATNDALMFEAFTERIPPRGTPVTLILTPKAKEAAKGA